MGEESSHFRILCLDGGGVRGLLSALILSNIEEHLNNIDGSSIPLGKRFDFISGTSTGGLISLALATGRTAKEIVNFYETWIPLIFSKQKRRGYFRSAFTSKYSSSVLKNALDDFFEDSTLKDVTTDVCIPSVALDSGKPKLYKSGYLNCNQGRLDEKLVDIALSTSAAPSFFPAHSSKYSSNLIDGGICANNPTMVALTDACQFERPSLRGNFPPNSIIGISQDKIRLLSIGTGVQCAMPYNYTALRSIVPKGLAESGWLFWGSVFPFMQISMESQSILVHHQAKFILGNSYYRIDPQLNFPIALDDASQITKLYNLADLDMAAEIFVNDSFR